MLVLITFFEEANSEQPIFLQEMETELSLNYILRVTHDKAD